MPTQSEPALERSQWTYERVRAAFIRGAIGPETFRASLVILGLRGQDLQAELNLAQMEKRHGRR